MQKTNCLLLVRLAPATLICWAGMAGAQPNPQLPPELVPYFKAIKIAESSGHPWSIYNNTIGKSYRLNSRAEAEAKAADLLSLGHNLDIGLMQLNWKYQGKRPGVTMANVFDPPVNEGIARQVFLEFWQQAKAVATDFESRIIAAVGAYNNGRVRLPNLKYVRKVWRELGKEVANLPTETTSNTAGTASGASQLDESLGRAVSKKDRRNLPEQAQGEDQADNASEQTAEDQDSPNAAGWLAVLAGGVLVGLGLWGLSSLIGAIGLFKTIRIARMAASATKSRAKEL